MCVSVCSSAVCIALDAGTHVQEVEVFELLGEVCFSLASRWENSVVSILRSTLYKAVVNAVMPLLLHKAAVNKNSVVSILRSALYKSAVNAVSMLPASTLP